MMLNAMISIKSICPIQSSYRIIVIMLPHPPNWGYPRYFPMCFLPSKSRASPRNDEDGGHFVDGDGFANAAAEAKDQKPLRGRRDLQV